ncbi:MAG TPA: dihydroorotate dehydrogenase 2 [Tepidisphaeraceae bacterium]|jgi:dihydroorotate dehydrogenase|nr:dihydroorotate dehydrogenase 2 [Tepidisphaeraceae bacterium]
MRFALNDFADRMGYRILRALPAEAAHDLGKWAMARRMLAPGSITFTAGKAPVLFGTTLPNPLGLAAGFDKNGQIVDAAIDYGFGFVEVGSVTFRGGPGNPKPRMFRVDDQTIMNRMGLNGDRAEVVAGRLTKVKTRFFGVNIAKTHSPDILGDAAIEDICSAYRLLNRFGLYTAINVSCPNTREGRTFEDPAPLAELLAALNAVRKGQTLPPLLVKLSPVLDPGEGDGAARLEQVLDVCNEAKIDGYICCNTLPYEHPKFGRGGISGNTIRPKAWRICEFITSRTKAPVIGCGGILTRDHLDAYLQRGCVAAQAYNGFVRGPLAGVRFAHRILGGSE